LDLWENQQNDVTVPVFFFSLFVFRPSIAALRRFAVLINEQPRERIEGGWG
jgi:hypothetical protein